MSARFAESDLFLSETILSDTVVTSALKRRGVDKERGDDRGEERKNLIVCPCFLAAARICDGVGC